MARFLNVSLPTIKWRLMRARRALHLGIDDVVARATELRRPGRQRTKEKILAALPLPAEGTTATEAARGALHGDRLQTEDEGVLIFPPCSAGKVRRR